jgi:hypothetical protein
MRLKITIMIFAGLFFLAFKAGATITDSSFYGFTIKHELTVNIAPDTLYKYLVDIGKWWDPEHTWSGKASNLFIQPHANGCFCERLDSEGSVRHMSVIYVQPGRILRLEGGLGPLQALAVTGVLTFEITTSFPVSKLTLTYTIGGYSPNGLKNLAPVVDRVLGDQLKRLKDYAEGKK